MPFKKESTKLKLFTNLKPAAAKADESNRGASRSGRGYLLFFPVQADARRAPQKPKPAKRDRKEDKIEDQKRKTETKKEIEFIKADREKRRDTDKRINKRQRRQKKKSTTNQDEKRGWVGWRAVRRATNGPKSLSRDL